MEKIADLDIEGPVDLSELSGPDKVVMGRTVDDTILIIMPPAVLGVTYMLLAADHLAMSCVFVNALAFHMGGEDIAATKVATPELIGLVTKGMLDRHNITTLEEGYIVKGQGDFEGLYHGEFTPIELASIAQRMMEVKQTFPREVREGNSVAGIIDLWINAGKKFVRDIELIALMGDEGRA